MERKLASIRKIDNIEPIEGADKIVCATIGGWKLVTAIDNGFNIGDLVIYFEIDSWIPNELAPFLSKGKEPREFNGVKGERLRTVKLRGQISQGLIMPVSILDGLANSFSEDDDFTELLNIQKWERPMNAQLAGMAKGNFPSFIFKTDQERIQNLTKEFESYQALTWEVTEKLEGSSMTVYMNNNEFGVCSRNLDLKETEGNTFWQVARDLDLESGLGGYPGNFAIQGELIGPGVQGNIYKLSKHEFRVFDIFDIDKQEYFNAGERDTFVRAYGLDHVPVVAYKAKMYNTLGIRDVNSLLLFTEGKSNLAHTEREGLVFKCIEHPHISFKSISNKFLLGEK